MAVSVAANVMNRFTKKFFPLLIMQLFFKIFLPQPPVKFSTNFNQSIICSFIKGAQKIAIKASSSLKNFSGSYERNRTLSAKRFRQTRFFRIQLRACLATTCFEQYIFHTNLENNICKQIYSQKCCRLLLKQEFIADIFVGIISSTQKFQEIVSCGVTFNISTFNRTLLNFVADDFTKVF